MQGHDPRRFGVSDVYLYCDERCDANMCMNESECIEDFATDTAICRCRYPNVQSGPNCENGDAFSPQRLLQNIPPSSCTDLQTSTRIRPSRFMVVFWSTSCRRTRFWIRQCSHFKPIRNMRWFSSSTIITTILCRCGEDWSTKMDYIFTISQGFHFLSVWIHHFFLSHLRFYPSTILPH